MRPDETLQDCPGADQPDIELRMASRCFADTANSRGVLLANGCQCRTQHGHEMLTGFGDLLDLDLLGLAGGGLQR